MNFWKDNFKELFLVLFLTAICIAFGNGTGLWFPMVVLMIIFWCIFLWLSWEWLRDYVMLLDLEEMEKENKAYLNEHKDAQEEIETDEQPTIEKEKDIVTNWEFLKYNKK